MIPSEYSALALTRLRQRRPLVHCLTNPVSINVVANALLAVGASPIMADHVCEAAEVTARSDALVLNLGMPNPDKLETLLLCALEANKKGIPIVFDPVGVSLTAFRQHAATRILAEAHPGIIRGNFSEISFLAGQSAASRGVDTDNDASTSQEDRLAHSIACAQAVSRKYKAVTVLTGEHDVISDSRDTQILAGGSIWLTRMTGAGCMLDALIAAYAAVAPDECVHSSNMNQSNRIAPALAALQCFSHAAKTAERRVQQTGSGSGSFHVFLLDALSTMEE